MDDDDDEMVKRDKLQRENAWMMIVEFVGRRGN